MTPKPGFRAGRLEKLLKCRFLGLTADSLDPARYNHIQRRLEVGTLTLFLTLNLEVGKMGTLGFIKYLSAFILGFRRLKDKSLDILYLAVFLVIISFLVLLSFEQILFWFVFSLFL